MKSPGDVSAKRLLSLLGGVVAVLCLYFFARAFYGAAGDISKNQLNTTVVAVSAACAVFYSAGLLLLAFGWRRLLIKANETETRSSGLVPVYAITQFAKYLPGNIFHLAGRHAVLSRKGFSHKALLISTLQENLLLVAGAAIAGIGLLVLLPLQAFVDRTAIPVISGAAVQPSIRLTVAAIWFAATIGLATFAAHKISRVEALPTLALNIVFFALQGVLFTAVFTSVTGTVRPEVMGLIALSWIAGFITPGAPGGIGVREVILLFALKGFASEADIVLSIALYRVATFAGDALFCAGGSIMRRDIQPLPAGSR